MIWVLFTGQNEPPYRTGNAEVDKYPWHSGDIRRIPDQLAYTLMRSAPYLFTKMMVKVDDGIAFNEGKELNV